MSWDREKVWVRDWKVRVGVTLGSVYYKVLAIAIGGLSIWF